MAELKLPRLLQAAKEFNIGQDTLIEFLIGKGFPKDDLKPTSKLAEEMYRALQLEFQGDKAAKMKSDQVDLPKGALAEAKKKKEDEEISFKKEDKQPLKITKKGRKHSRCSQCGRNAGKRKSQKRGSKDRTRSDETGSA